MSQFKYKPDKLKNQEKISTLDDTHRNYVKEFERERTSIEQKKTKLSSLSSKLSKLNNVDQSTLSLSDIKMKSNLKDEIANLNKEIMDVTNHTSELDYYSKIDNILLRYYDIIDNTGNSSPSPASPNRGNVMSEQVVTTQRKQVRKRTRTPRQAQKNILCFFEDSNEQSAKNPQGTKQTTPNETTLTSDSPLPTVSTTSDNILSQSSNSPQETQLPKNRAYLYEQYMKATNNNVFGNRTTKRPFNPAKFCEKCKIERMLVQSDGMYVCSQCGESESALIESDIPNYKDSNQEKPSYPYKRLNHLVE